MSKWNAETAEWYAAKYGEYPTNRLAVDALDLAPDAAVVDLGCGTGAALRHAAAKVTQGVLIGIDPVERMIEIARERTASHVASDRIEFRTGPAEALPVADEVADVVLAFDSFDHWESARAGLAEVRRILRPGGRLVVVKDGGVPSARDFGAEAERAGFKIEDERSIRGEEIRFRMWVCG